MYTSHVAMFSHVNASLLRTRSVLPMTSDNYIVYIRMYMHKISKSVHTYVSRYIILQFPAGNIQ